MIFLIGSGSRRTSVGIGQDLVAACELWILQEIDDLDLVAPLQMVLADLLQVREGQDRLRRLSRDVEPQHVRLGFRRWRGDPVFRQLHGDRVLPANRAPGHSTAPATRHSRRRCPAPHP